MSTHQPPSRAAQAAQAYDRVAARHIRELSSLNEQIPELLHQSAATISLLTNSPVAQDAPINSPADRAPIILEKSYQLFVLINTMRTKLHDQVKLLESEKVIPPAPTRYIPVNAPPGMSEQDRAQMENMRNAEASVKNGGMGGLDISMLNARAGARQQGSDEVLSRAQNILEDLIKRKDGQVDETMVDG